MTTDGGSCRRQCARGLRAYRSQVHSVPPQFRPDLLLPNLGRLAKKTDETVLRLFPVQGCMPPLQWRRIDARQGTVALQEAFVRASFDPMISDRGNPIDRDQYAQVLKCADLPWGGPLEYQIPSRRR